MKNYARSAISGAGWLAFMTAAFLLLFYAISSADNIITSFESDPMLGYSEVIVFCAENPDFGETPEISLNKLRESLSSLNGVTLTNLLAESGVSIKASVFGKMPSERQVVGGDNPEQYALLKQMYNEGKDPFFSFRTILPSLDVAFMTDITVAEGRLPDEKISYTECISNNMPIPVAVGSKLADLFPLGSEFRVCMSQLVETDKIDEFYQNVGDGNVTFKVVGVLAPDSKAAYEGVNSLLPIGNCIILPQLGTAKGIEDICASNRLYNWFNIMLVVHGNASEALESIRSTIVDCGLGNAYDFMHANDIEFIRYKSLHQYSTVLVSLFAALFVLLITAACFAVNRTVNKNIRQYSIKFMLGMKPGVMALGLAVRYAVIAVLASACSVAVLYFMRKSNVGGFRPAVIHTDTAILIAAAASAVFILLISAVTCIRLSHTDFSRSLKEARE